MSYRACRPVLLVEGDGDREAVPHLCRRVFPVLGAVDCGPAPRPIMCGDIPKLRRIGALEKFLEYACRRSDGDSVVLLVDCDDDCPLLVAKQFHPRACEIAGRFRKKIAIGFMYREFETLFLYSLRELQQNYPAYGWLTEESDYSREWSETRGAKGALNRLMRNYYYKETRDQVRFVSVVDLEIVRNTCRSAKHLFQMLEWLLDDTAEEWVYPHFSPAELAAV
jgi:hypothetical protein